MLKDLLHDLFIFFRHEKIKGFRGLAISLEIEIQFIVKIDIAVEMMRELDISILNVVHENIDRVIVLIRHKDSTNKIIEQFISLYLIIFLEDLFSSEEHHVVVL